MSIFIDTQDVGANLLDYPALYIKRVRVKERGGKEMEFFILMISVPLFLLVVLLLSVFVLANYSGDEPAKNAPTETKVPETIESSDNVVAKE